MRIWNALKLELVILLVLVVVAGLMAWRTTSRAAENLDLEEIASGDLEPFRSAFNTASDRTRAVLLVGPT